MKIRQDTILGSFFAVVGMTAFLMALQYPIGTANRMGPGYFPVIVSALLGLTGAAILLRARFGQANLVEAVRWKPLAIVSAAIVVFGLLIERLGLPLSIFVLLIVAGTASLKFAWNWRAVAAAAAFSIVCGLLFVRLLGLPIPMLGSWLQAFGL